MKWPYLSLPDLNMRYSFKPNLFFGKDFKDKKNEGLIFLKALIKFRKCGKIYIKKGKLIECRVFKIYCIKKGFGESFKIVLLN